MGWVRHATDIDQLIVVSMGTGTSFVKNQRRKDRAILVVWQLAEVLCSGDFPVYC